MSLRVPRVYRFLTPLLIRVETKYVPAPEGMNTRFRTEGSRNAELSERVKAYRVPGGASPATVIRRVKRPPVVSVLASPIVGRSPESGSSADGVGVLGMFGVGDGPGVGVTVVEARHEPVVLT